MLNKIIRISLLSSLIIVGVLGIVLTALSTDFMGGAAVFLYFTVQSNIFIILMALITLVDEVVSIFTKKSFMNQVLLYIKFSATIAITITFIVFFTMLAPLLGPDYLLSFNNFSLHAIVPIIAIVDFILFDTKINLSYPKSLFGCIPPLCYMVFVYVGVPLKFQYGENIKFPYFFLDYDTNGFFFEKGLGIMFWIFVLLIGISGLCLLFCLFIKLRQRSIAKKS
jgi:hypothetical protein